MQVTGKAANAKRVGDRQGVGPCMESSQGTVRERGSWMRSVAEEL